MATEQTAKTASTAKFEAFVDQQLNQVRRRLRAVDLGAAVLLLVAITLGYAALMAVFDLLARGSQEAWVSGVRLVAFGLYLLAMAGGAYLLVARLLRRINPYYCAHELELTLPGAKNSVINWLDLKDDRLPGAIRSSLGMKAARDLKEADAEKVVDPRQTWTFGVVAAFMLVVLVIVFAISPGQFGSLLARAFVPFRDITLASRTTIQLVRPIGDVTVPQNQRVEFLAQIDGRFPRVNHPQAPTLWYRYGPAEPFASMPLEEDGNGEWGAVMAADLVRTGFWYKLSAGDAETPTYQVGVRSQPAATRFEVTYRYRPYRKLTDETIVFPNEEAVLPELRGQRGTEVALIVRTNQPVREGWLQLQFGKENKRVDGERLPDDPKAFRCRFTLERSGQYVVLFKTQDEESNTDRIPYQIDVIDDLTPTVVLTKPGKDVSIAANGTLPLEGIAQDDFGVKALALHLKVLEAEQKPALAAKPYRAGKSFQFETGHYPAKIDYADLLALDQIKTDKGAAFPLSAGMVLEYWLEATDNADYPIKTGNVGRSKSYKLKIEAPKDQKEQQKERQQAEDQQKKHEKQQDQQHQKENRDKKDEVANQNSNKSPEERKAEKLKEELDQAEKKVKEALDRQEEKKNQGESKGEDPSKSDSKQGDGQPQDAKPKDAPSEKQPAQAGDKKDQGAKGDAKPSEAKNQGDKQPQGPDEKQQASEPKGAGNEKPQASAKGQEPKNGPPNGADQTGSAKAGPKESAKEQPGEGKDGGNQGDTQKPAQAKENSPKEDKMNQGGAQAKSAEGNKDAPSPQTKNEKQGPDQAAGKKGDTKPGKNEEITKEKGQGNTKPDTTASKNPPGADGTRRPADAKGQDEPVRKAQSKEGAGKGTEETQQGPPAQAKNQPMNPNAKPPEGSQQGSAKETPPDQAKESATAKNEKGQAPPREPTAQDLERLKEQLAKGDPKALKNAEELKRNLPESKDPELSKNAEELLKNAEKTLEKMAKEHAPKEGPNPPNAPGTGPEQNPMTAQSTPMKGQPGGNEKQPGAKQGDNDPKNKPGPETTAGAKPAGSGPGGDGAQEKPNPSQVNKDFDRVGNLQLEQLKDRITPDVLKSAGMTEEEWRQHIKNAQAYEELRNKLAKRPKGGPDKLIGKTSQLPSVGPRQVNNEPSAESQGAVGRGQVPPELRKAHDLFTKQK